jgi:hypothetical protein
MKVRLRAFLTLGGAEWLACHPGYLYIGGECVPIARKLSRTQRHLHLSSLVHTLSPYDCVKYYVCCMLITNSLQCCLLFW